jgi:hypothetical protein
VGAECQALGREIRDLHLGGRTIVPDELHAAHIARSGCSPDPAAPLLAVDDAREPDAETSTARVVAQGCGQEVRLAVESEVQEDGPAGAGREVPGAERHAVGIEALDPSELRIDATVHAPPEIHALA